MSLHCYEVCMALQASRGGCRSRGACEIRKSFEGSILFSMHCHQLSDAHAKAPPLAGKISEQHLLVSSASPRRKRRTGALIYKHTCAIVRQHWVGFQEPCPSIIKAASLGEEPGQRYRLMGYQHSWDYVVFQSSQELGWEMISSAPPGALTGCSQADRLQGQMAGMLCSGPLPERSDGLAQRPLRSGEKTPPPSWPSQTRR